ncbi:helix-turn-helix domain-containing protein [Microcoleus sp. FACHB-1515]|uniref:helix-turn-helix domain-containing protein n=1 Tax=Leptolyngbya sp. FACHB-1515 TaxID=2933931 RepID=UPI0016836216|nr:helix-turn-helix domain-containing protein [Microcoleus sp. FACHB-1515]
MSEAVDYTHRLRSHMQSVGVLSFRALSRQSGVSERQIDRLRRGEADRMQVQSLHKIGQVLNLSIAQLIEQFSSLSIESAVPVESNLQQEYQRLQVQLVEQRETLKQEFQRSTLQSIESWLLQFPTAAYAAQQNPQLPAVRLLPLMRPIEQLLQDWGVEAIAAVGEEVPFDPQLHQLMDGSANLGDRVRIRYAGYRQGDRLLHRAKVSPV